MLVIAAIVIDKKNRALEFNPRLFLLWKMIYTTCKWNVYIIRYFVTLCNRYQQKNKNKPWKLIQGYLLYIYISKRCVRILYDN